MLGRYGAVVEASHGKAASQTFALGEARGKSVPAIEFVRPYPPITLYWTLPLSIQRILEMNSPEFNTELNCIELRT